MRIVSAAGVLLCLGACSTPALHWGDHRRIEDPSPSGPPDLRAYKETYYRSLGERIAGFLGEEELQRRIDRAKLLYLGDRHDDRAVHDRMLVLLEALHVRGIHLTLGLEAIGVEDEELLRAYLDRQLSMAELRRRIRARWPGSWLEAEDVDSSFYRALLVRAREWEVPVFALEPVPREALHGRAVLMAASVRKARHRHPDRLVVVVVGQAHLSGGGRLIERVGEPWVACTASLSTSLIEQLAVQPVPEEARYLVTSSGIVVFN